MYTRCSKHTAREVLPTGCPTCARIALENDIVTRTVDALLAAGYGLRVDDRDGTFRPGLHTNDRAAILAELQETDEDYLQAHSFTRPVGWVRFVYGNDGWDVICDYSTKLESVLTEVHAYVDSIAP